MTGTQTWSQNSSFLGSLRRGDHLITLHLYLTHNWREHSHVCFFRWPPNLRFLLVTICAALLWVPESWKARASLFELQTCSRLLRQLPRCWDYSHAPPCLACHYITTLPAPEGLSQPHVFSRACLCTHIQAYTYTNF